MNARVDFNIAKLLKEKGYDNESSHFYNKEGMGRYDRDYPSIYNTKGDYYCDMPTVSDTVMWIYSKHGIWIWVSMELGYTNTFCWQLTGEHTSSNYKAFFKTPTEAYVDAISYTLNNLL